jgi:RimJ/RimL family protein N-acetyltransferase
MYQVNCRFARGPVPDHPGCDHGRVHVPPIRTARFELVSMSMRFMRLLLARDLDAASTEIGVPVPADLPDQLDNFLQFRIADLEVDPSAEPWLGRAIAIREPDGTTRFVGTAGFHSPPDADGRVEVGYRVEPPYRRQGVATEVVRGLFDWAAREHGIHRFRAAVAPDNEASLAVVGRLGFQQTGVQIDDIDGEELVFELDDWIVTPRPGE